MKEYSNFQRIFLIIEDRIRRKLYLISNKILTKSLREIKSILKVTYAILVNICWMLLIMDIIIITSAKSKMKFQI